METTNDMYGNEIRVSVLEGQEPNEYSLTLDYEGHCSMSASGNLKGGDFCMYSMTPESLANLAWAIIGATAKAKTVRELGAVEPTQEEAKL